MRKYIIASLAGAVLFLGLSHAPVSGQNTRENSPSPSRDERIAEAKDQRQAHKEAVAEKRAEAQKEFKAKREEFKEKLEDIKSARKQKILSNIDERIAKINEVRTDRLSEHLIKMSEILDRIEEKAAQLDDPSDADEAIEEARAAIQTAQAAVEEQAGIQYVVEITDEESLRADAKLVVDAFKSDIKAVVALVKDAHKETREAAQELGDIKSTSVKNNTSDAKSSDSKGE